MYINPIVKQGPNLRPAEKRKKAAGQTSFVEHVETLLGLDAVDIASAKREQGTREDELGGQLQREAQEDQQSGELAPKTAGENSVNVRA